MNALGFSILALEYLTPVKFVFYMSPFITIVVIFLWFIDRRLPEREVSDTPLNEILAEG